MKSIRKEINIDVSGRVQGVLFRDKVKSYAETLGLKGFVMNKQDGSVSILAQGIEMDLNEFTSWIQSGPGFSKIMKMSYNLGNVGKDYPDFRIIREGSFFYDKAKSLVNLGKFLISGEVGVVPKHIAIIPDGNRRWAKRKGYEGTFGHYKSGTYDSLEEIFIECKKLGVKCCSIWGFSTENWKRSSLEKKEIFNLILSGVDRFLKDAHKNRIKFRHVGRKDRLPRDLVNALVKLENSTSDYNDFIVQLCLDYGGRDEIVRGVNKVLDSKVKKIDEASFADFLDCKDVPDPDLIIRTSGEKRLSGLMPFQSAYAELYFTEKFFPDFGVKELREAVKEFGRRQRRFGGGS